MKLKFKGPHTTPKEEVYLFLLLFLILFVINGIICLISKTGFSMGEFVSSSFFVFIMSGIIGGVVYIVLKNSGYYEQDAYEIDIGERKIRIRNWDMIWDIDGGNIKRLAVSGNILKVWPRDYYYFIDSSVGIERHSYYAAMEQKLPLQFRLPALSREDRKRLKATIEEFKFSIDESIDGDREMDKRAERKNM